MRDQLIALARISEIDASARELDRELKEIPERLNELRMDVQRLEDLLARERQELAAAEKMRTSVDEDIVLKNDNLGKARSKGAKSRNAREIEMAEREVETIRRMIRDREAEREKLGSAINDVKKRVEDHEREFGELRNLFSAQEEKGRNRIAELQEQRSKVVVGRDEFAKKIPANVLKRYDAIRAKRGVGVADVIDGTCQGCRMAIPAQQYIKIQRCEEIEQCPHCVRIVLYRPALEMPATPA